MKIFMKRALAALLLLLCFLPVLRTEVRAATIVDSGTCGENLTWTLDSWGTLTISGTGPMEDYSTDIIEGTAPWSGHFHIKKIVIEEGVTTIGSNAFDNCKAKLMIPASVTSFGNLTSSTYLPFLMQVHRETDILGIWVDDNNPNYSSDENGVLFDKNKTSLIMAPVTLSGEYIVPTGVISIEDCAFYKCVELTNVTIPNTVTSIGDYAFYSCFRLTSVTIPASVTDIGETPFYGWWDLEGIWVDAHNPNYSSDSYGVLFDKNKTRLIRMPPSFSGDYSIPYGVLSVDSYAFEKSQLTKLTIPNSVTSIGDYAFSGSSKLNGVMIPESVISIGICPFRECWDMYEIRVDENNPNYSSDGRGALFNKDKTHLIQVPSGITGEYVIPDGVTSIGDSAFYFCNHLENVTIPDGVSTIGDFAFYAGPNLEDTRLPASLTFVGLCAFSGVHISNVTIPAGMEYVGDYAFESCTITELTISEGVTSIGDNAFHDCSGLTSVTIPEGVTSIGDGAFSMCIHLTNVTLPDSLISIGDRAFEACRFSNITIPDNVHSIGRRAFISCTELRNITIPDSVVFLGDGAFSLCYNLTDATISHNAVSVVESASYKRVVQNSMTIAQKAFGDCRELSSIRFIGDAPIICEDAFLSVTANAYYPMGNATWMQDMQQNYGGTLTWIPLSASGFSDVYDNAYYAAPVLWAVENNITTGMTETTFAPDATCTRAQIVTFLWRANGRPAPASANNPFTDVPAGQWYTDAVLWAVERGITAGTSATTFSPEAGCTRGQVATFLHRAQGKPAYSSGNPFTDLASGAYYYDAVLWAVTNGITNGMGNGTFAPDATCTRGQIVTFLYRAMA